METKPKPTETFAVYCLPQIQSDIGDLMHYSIHLDHLLWEHGWPLDNVSAETFQQTALDIYAQARLTDDALPFSTLAVYVSAFADILEERLKE